MLLLSFHFSLRLLRLSPLSSAWLLIFSSHFRRMPLSQISIDSCHVIEYWPEAFTSSMLMLLFTILPACFRHISYAADAHCFLLAEASHNARWLPFFRH